MQRKVSNQKMFDIAFETVLMNGYSNTSIRGLMGSAGLGKGSFPNYFKSKEDMGIHVLEVFILKQKTWQKLALGDISLSPINRIKKYFSALILFFKENTQYRGGCLAGNLSLELADINEPFREKLDSFFNDLNYEFTECIKEGQRIGEINEIMYAEDLAELVMITWEGALLRMKIMKTDYALDLYMNSFFELLKNPNYEH